MIAGLKSVSIGLVFLITACERPPADSGWAATADTLDNGAVLVVNHPNAAPSSASWSLEEELRIGAVDEDGPATFGQIKGLAVAADGRIALLEAQAQEIRVFDATGRHLATHGRQGQGPGEFSGAWGLMMGPDGMLWVPDHANARMSVVDFEKGFVTSFPMPIRGYGWVWPGVMTGDGRILDPPLVPDARGRNVLRVYDQRMTLVDSVLLPPDPPFDPQKSWVFSWESRSKQSSGNVSIPFAAIPHRTLDPRGFIWSAPGDAYRIIQWRPGGDTTLIIETRREGVAVTAAERDSAINDLQAYFREQGAPYPDWSRIPKTRPPIARMFVGDAGRLWVERASPDSLRRFDVYEPDGRIAGTATTHLRLNRWVPPVVRGDSLWAVAVDDMDVQYVVRARITH